MFTEAQKTAIIDNWNDAVYKNLLRSIELYTEKWKLSNLTFLEYYSMNAIFFCKSEPHGDSILKIGCGYQDDEFVSEYNVLSEYGGKKFVKIYEGDIVGAAKAMLLERVSPGTRLIDNLPLDERLAVYSGLYDRLHIEPENPAIYMKYADKLGYYVNYIKGRGDCGELYAHALKAKEIYGAVSEKYDRVALLHGDLHSENIILGSGEYIIIDPQGLAGDPVFEIPRFILNTYYKSIDMPKDALKNSIKHMIHSLEGSLSAPGEIIKQCFYIETVMFECWRASTGGYDVRNVLFADTV